MVGRKLAALGSLALFLAACGIEGPALAGYDGLQFKVRSFYRKHAVEENRTCRAPEIRGFTDIEVVEDTEERLVLDISYRYRDTRYAEFRQTLGGDFFVCNGFATRTFVVDKNGDELRVARMTGPQQQRRDFSG